MSENTSAKQYFKECFDKKLLIRKGIIAAIALALVLIFSLSFYFWLVPMAPKTAGEAVLPFGSNGFWYIKIIWNDGLGFSGMRGNLAGIYSVQTLMFLLLVTIFLLMCKDKITSSFVSLAMFGGLFNLLQRACCGNHCVLDYFQFGFWENFATFNWPDMFVVIGIFGFVISYIALLIVEYGREKRATDVTPINSGKPEEQ